MLTPDLLNAVKSYTENMQHPVALVLQKGTHEKRAELKQFLTDLCAVSDALIFEEAEQLDWPTSSPISFQLEIDGKPNGIRFSGIPGGHEFNSLILAILHSSGTALKFDESITQLINNIQQPLNFEVFISLSCHNCPEIVQAMNGFATLNSNITSEMIDGGLFKNVLEERDIQGVPTVYLNGELFATGKVSVSQMIEKLGELGFAANENQKASEKPRLPLQDVTVIGGGPAGIAAAIYAARKGLAVTLVAEEMAGQVKETMGIENLISVPKTTGPELATNMQLHLDDYDVNRITHFRVTGIQTSNNSQHSVKTLTLSSGQSITSKTVIIATGAKWRELGVPGEKENIGNGIAYCPHCDGPFFKGKDVAVIGGGNSGIEAALDLAGIVKSVSVFEFLPELKADKILIDLIEKRDNISVRTNVATKQFVATDGKVTSIEYEDRANGNIMSQSLDGAFIQIGLIPNSEFVKDLITLSKHGEIVINERCETSMAGVYAAGDVSTVPYKQIVIAMGEGAKASLSAFDYLLQW